MQVTIAIPGLFWQDIGDIDYLYPKLELSNFAAIVKHATMKNLNYSYSDLVYLPGNTTISGSLASHLAAKAELGSHHYRGFLLAEPTHLRLNRDCLQISEAELLQMDEEEAQLIIDKINAHFAGEIKLYYININLWLLGHNLDLADCRFYPIVDIIGENIDDYLSKGTGAITLNKLLNEIQMLLYGIPTNRQRQEEGSLTINSLWLWDKTLKPLSNYSHIYTNNQTELLSHAKIYPIPQAIDEAFIDNSLIILDNLYYPCCYRDSFAWMDKLQALDSQLGLPLREALNNGKIQELNILVPGSENTIQLQIKPGYKYKFWQNKQLINLVKESHAL